MAIRKFLLQIFSTLSTCFIVTCKTVSHTQGFEEKWLSGSNGNVVPHAVIRGGIVERAEGKAGNAICYDDILCFKVGDNFTHPQGLPSSPARVNATTWIFWPGQTPDIGQEVNFTTVDILTNVTELKTTRTLFILIHGFRQSRHHVWIRETTNSLLTKFTDSIVLTVDWGQTHTIFPLQPALDTALVGKILALLVEALIQKFPGVISPQKIHVIGFSFGAHVASFFAKHINNDTGKLVGRITGLDPAASYFEDFKIHLSKTDAEFVDIIHTSAGRYGHSMFWGDVGFKHPIGHVDFYPNGGTTVQPGCSRTLWPFCSHSEAFKFFLSSINRTCIYQSYSCGGGLDAALKRNCTNLGQGNEMGFYSSKNKGLGIQYLEARALPEVEVLFKKNKK